MKKDNIAKWNNIYKVRTEVIFSIAIFHNHVFYGLNKMFLSAKSSVAVFFSFRSVI